MAGIRKLRKNIYPLIRKIVKVSLFIQVILLVAHVAVWIYLKFDDLLIGKVTLYDYANYFFSSQNISLLGVKIIFLFVLLLIGYIIEVNPFQKLWFLLITGYKEASEHYEETELKEKATKTADKIFESYADLDKRVIAIESKLSPLYNKLEKLDEIFEKLTRRPLEVDSKNGFTKETKSS